MCPGWRFFLLASLAQACSNGVAPRDATVDADAIVDTAPPDVFVANREPGQRTPLSAACDAVDPTRCLLPWPSNTFTVVDTTTPTGLRVAITTMGIAMADDPTSIDRADGFSRVSPILTAFPGAIDPTSLGSMQTGAVRVIVEQPGLSFGQLVPMRYDLVNDGDTQHLHSMIVAYTLVPLAPATDYAVVVTDDVRTTAGDALTPDRNAWVALGLATPTTVYEGALYAYAAPARMAMVSAGIDPNHVLRIWDFTTRSLADPTGDLVAMRSTDLAAVDSPTPTVAVAVDTVTPMTGGSVAIVVEGRLTGVPNFLTTAGSLSRDATGAPLAMGVHDAPFRVAVPVGTGNYDVVMYGHGTGGNYHDSAFDTQITGAGACKVGIQFLGWTDTTLLDTFASFTHLLSGTDVSTAGLTQSVADAMAIQHALPGTIGDVLSADSISGMANPASGRRPDTSVPIWAGGSLGGTMGFVYSAAEPSIVAAVLNVPGAAWTHFTPYSTLFSAARLVVREDYPDDVDLFLALATSQINWDPIDGATWVDAVGTHQPLLLEQESMGDPVLPNIGNEMVATASHANQVGVVLSPIVGLTDVPQAIAHDGMTQFRVPSSVTDALEIHGFAAHDTPAGVAAQQQIQAFIESVWAGAPVITVPPMCESNTPAGSCDFSGS